MKSGSTGLTTGGSERVLQKSLSDLEKERKRIWIAKGVVEFVLVLFVSLGLVSLFAHIYSNSIYFSTLKIFAILAVCFGFVKFLISAILKKERKAELALELEKISPGLGENTLNAVLLTSDLTKHEELGVSKSLIEAHIDEVARKLESLDLSAALPREKIKGYWRPLAAALVLSATTLILAPKEFRSFLFSTSILPTLEPRLLEFADIKIEYRYPAYTKIPSQAVKGSTGDVRGVKGTHVTFEATPLRPLDRGELVIQNGLVTPVSSEKEKIKGEFTILSNGGFFIQDESGKLRSRIFKITSEEDKNPKVAIESPSSKDVIEIQEKENLDIFYRAEDDFGVGKLLLTWKTKRGEATKSIAQRKEEPRTIENKFTWDLSGVESDPGEIIDVKIKAYDNDTVSGPKVGVSNVIKVKLNSGKKEHENVMASVEKVLEEFLDTLGDEIETRPKDNSINISSTKKIQEGIAIKIEGAISSLDKVLEKMKEDDFSDYTYFVGLSNMKVRIEDMLDERYSLLPSFSAKVFPRLDGLITREINEFEDDILFLDSIIKGEKLKESVLYGRDTLSKYNELSELLQNLKQSGDEATRKEIEKKIEELRSLMSQLSQKLSSITRDIHEGFLNPDAFEVMDLEGKLDEIMNLINQGKIDEALNLLAGLEANFEEMIAMLQSGFQSFSSASLSKEITELGEIISRIKSLEEQEKSLKENTGNLKESFLKDPSKKGNPLWFVEREKKKVEKLKNLLMEAGAKIFRDTAEEGSILIERTLNDTDELKHWLESFEFREAFERAKDIEEQTIGLRNLKDLRVGRTPKASREIEESAELAEEIRRDLEHFQEIEGKEGRMRQLAERQDEIQKETSGLGDNIRDLSQDNFLLSPEIGKKLDESKGFMHSASGNLKGKEISKAISDQEEAIKALKEAGEEAKGLLQKYQLSARGRGLSVPLVLGREQFPQEGLGVDTSHVDIPSPEESKTGREFKESLLKALKEGSPEGYSELNKRYYERIIK